MSYVVRHNGFATGYPKPLVYETKKEASNKANKLRAQIGGLDDVDVAPWTEEEQLKLGVCSGCGFRRADDTARQIYECSSCGADVCAGCSENAPSNDVICLGCWNKKHGNP